MTDSNQNPGRKWRYLENDGDGNKYFDTYRFTPFTTDLEFFRDPNIYEADEVARVTQDDPGGPRSESDSRPRGERRSDESIKEEIQQLLDRLDKVNTSAIQVDVHGGVVTLSGNVDNQDEKRTVERIARNAFGIAGVENRLKVNSQES